MGGIADAHIGLEALEALPFDVVDHLGVVAGLGVEAQALFKGHGALAIDAGDGDGIFLTGHVPEDLAIVEAQVFDVRIRQVAEVCREFHRAEVDLVLDHRAVRQGGVDLRLAGQLRGLDHHGGDTGGTAHRDLRDMAVGRHRPVVDILVLPVPRQRLPIDPDLLHGGVRIAVGDELGIHPVRPVMVLVVHHVRLQPQLGNA